ncbi:MAG TPA: hypothetical protein PLG57_06585 [Bacteroidia bacterium]|nr:hypothetical protein [Bacteroidia bacterium]HQF27981.1 hypothetical protein [Bacteroidia bacterium]HQK97862.1 hypothetical protein [Bacteroidia bacterium]
MHRLYLLVMISFLLSSCKKDDSSEMSSVPEIEMVSVTPLQPKEYSDSIVFTIRYKDGDGDLGENDPDVKNLFLTDNRIGITHQYRIQQLAPSGTTIAIEGNLNVVLNNLVITDSSATQNANFSIYVKDRAGNKSNVITSPTITIHS